MASETLTLRRLNRATLARQLLLERHAMPALDAIERLAGLQAQLARPPFVGLWTRLQGFRREELSSLASGRQVARATMMRATLHLVSTRDYLRFRPVLQSALTAGAQTILGTRLDALDLPRLLDTARELFGTEPRPFDDLRQLLVEGGLPGDVRAQAYAVRLHLPLVQLPDEDAAWGWDGKAPFGLAEQWLGAPCADDPRPHEMVRRYLAAFGPATPADAAAWSGLRGMKGVFDELRPELRTFRDERGRELFDLPDAPRPREDVEAPVRLLPEFDNLVLGHDDRSRVVAPEHRPRLYTKNGLIPGTFLVDGFVAGTWRIEARRRLATMTLEPFARLPKRVRTELEREGEALLRFVEPEAREHAVTVSLPG